MKSCIINAILIFFFFNTQLEGNKDNRRFRRSTVSQSDMSLLFIYIFYYNSNLSSSLIQFKDNVRAIEVRQK
jgi:hypothetical protein